MILTQARGQGGGSTSTYTGRQGGQGGGSTSTYRHARRAGWQQPPDSFALPGSCHQPLPLYEDWQQYVVMIGYTYCYNSLMFCNPEYKLYNLVIPKNKMLDEND